MEIFNSSTTSFDPAIRGPISMMNTAEDITANMQDSENESADKISVSRDALLWTEALRAARSAPDVREDKLEAIRQQIANGTYEIDAKRIATSLIREEAGLFMR